MPTDPRARNARSTFCILGVFPNLSFTNVWSIINLVTFTVETEQKTDGRWIAEIGQIPGAMAYGATRDEAIARVEALGLRVLAERIEQGETSPEIQQVFTVAAA